MGWCAVPSPAWVTCVPPSSLCGSGFSSRLHTCCRALRSARACVCVYSSGLVQPFVHRVQLLVFCLLTTSVVRIHEEVVRFPHRRLRTVRQSYVSCGCTADPGVCPDFCRVCAGVCRAIGSSSPSSALSEKISTLQCVDSLTCGTLIIAFSLPLLWSLRCIRCGSLLPLTFPVL